MGFRKNAMRAWLKSVKIEHLHYMKHLSNFFQCKPHYQVGAGWLNQERVRLQIQQSEFEYGWNFFCVGNKMGNLDFSDN